MLKTAWYWYSNRQADQWNRIEDPEVNPQTYGHLIFDKGATTIRWNKDSLFNKWCWFNWKSTCRRMRIDPILSLCTKINSKWIKDLHIKPDTLKLLEKKLGKTLEDLGTGEKNISFTQCLKAHSYLSQELRNIPRTHVQWLTTFCNSSSKGYDASVDTSIYVHKKTHKYKSTHN